MIYVIKKKTITEAFFVLILYLTLILPFVCLFKNTTSVNQRVAIPPSKLGRAKLFMFFSGGLWWIYLRYLAKQCPKCNCVWYKELVSSTVLDIQQEEYVYKDKVTTKHYAGPMTKYNPDAISVTKVDKVGIKTVTTEENTYKCVNCDHIENRIESNQDLGSTLNQLTKW